MEDLAYPHQISGAKHFATSGKGILADDMGLGKGLTSLLWLAKIGARKTLVTGPKEITSNLRNEIPKWLKDKPLIDLRGYRPDQREMLFELVEEFDDYIVLLNLESWRTDHKLIDLLISLQLDSVIIDEAHHLNSGKTATYRGIWEVIYAVNRCASCTYRIIPRYTCRRKQCARKGERFRTRRCLSCGWMAAKVVIPRCEVCGEDPNKDLAKARSVKNVLPMTGTPIVNHQTNLYWVWSLFDETLGTERDFLDEYCEVTVESQNRHRWKPGAQEKLAKRIAPYYLARKRSDVGIRIPPQTVTIREYDFDKRNYSEQWEAYERLAKNFKLDLENETLGVTEVVVQLLRLRQMLVWPNGIVIRDPETKEIVDQVNIGRSFKLDVVTNLAREFLESGQRIVVFSHFTAPLHELQRRLGVTSVVYDGSTTQSRRTAIRADFGSRTDSPRWDALLCNYRSAGEGLNLIGASQAIILDEDWSPGKNRQAYARIQRIGQTQETGVHIPRVLKTVDMWMAALNDFKAEIVDGFDESTNLQQRLLEAMR